MVELPVQLDPPRNPNENIRQSTQLQHSVVSPTHAAHPSTTNINGDASTPSGFSDILTTVDDWRFLDVFGHAEDNFYAIDAELRNILEGQMVDDAS